MTKAKQTTRKVNDTWMGRHRTKAKLTQEQMAEILSVTREQYVKIEKVEEPNTWCARALDRMLRAHGVRTLKQE